MSQFDFAVIGGGIIGISTALALQKKYPDSRIVLIEKEKKLATHQTGHNSGVVHAGVYYAPGSLKAEFCKQGAALTKQFCQMHDLPYRQIGKMLVATDDNEYKRMQALKERCRLNMIETDEISEDELRRMEPNITGCGALLVHETAITDYPLISKTMGKLFESAGGTIKMGSPIIHIKESADEVVLSLFSETVKTQFLVACAGLQADRIAQMMGIEIGFRIVPFRGEYYQLPPHHTRIVSKLIYPIPDPNLPFLGVHLTPMISGTITVGPNAVLGFKREGYGWFNFSPVDMMNMIRFRGFWKVIGANWRSGLGEWIDSNWKPGYLKRVKKYCPSLNLGDLKPYPAGIRAQAVMNDGTLVHDFLFVGTQRSLHVCNAPSPAATSAIPISEYICGKIQEKLS
jgi:L-2-hydroxyglutarate oxidase